MGTTSTLVPAVIPPGSVPLPDPGPTDGIDPTDTALPLPGGEISMNVDNAEPIAGGNIQVTAEGLEPGQTRYRLVLGDADISTALTADGEGRITVQVAIPEAITGVLTLHLVDTDQARIVATTELAVRAAGSSVSTIAIAMGALMAVLAVAFLIGTRRRRDDATTEVGTGRPPAPLATVTPATHLISDEPAANPEPFAGPEATHADEPAGPEMSADPEGAQADETESGDAAAKTVATDPIDAANGDASTLEVTLPGPAFTGIPSRPWSRLALGGTPLATGRATDAATWDGALWITGVADTSTGTQVVVWSSLNGLTWSEPVVVGRGSQPKFASDRTRLYLIAEDAENLLPAIWMTTDGSTWRSLASGLGGQPAGNVTSAMVAGGLLLLAVSENGGSCLWAGHPDGAWIQLDVGFKPQLLARWGKHLLGFGHRPNGLAVLAQSEAGIRWTMGAVDAPPSYHQFAPDALYPLGDEAILVGEDTATGGAEAWVGRTPNRWDPAPIGVPIGTRIAGGVIADGGLVVVGVARRDVSVLRTIRGIRWQQVDATADLADFDFVAVTRYEGRIHLLGMDQGEPVIWVRQGFPTPKPSDTASGAKLRLVVDGDVAAERLA